MSDRSKSIRMATAADRDRIVPVVNAAFAVEDFFEVLRTDQQDMAQLMQTGKFLILKDDTVLKDEVGRVIASIYVDGSTDGSRTSRTPLPTAMREIDSDSLDLAYRDRMVALARQHLPGRVGLNIDGFAGRYLP